MPRHVKTHCKSGHEFTAANTILKPYRRGVMRVCRTCQRRWDANYRNTQPRNRATPELEPKALARLREAYADGVPNTLLAQRFGISSAAVVALGKVAA